jgi:hypothetical protein
MIEKSSDIHTSEAKSVRDEIDILCHMACLKQNISVTSINVLEYRSFKYGSDEDQQRCALWNGLLNEGFRDFVAMASFTEEAQIMTRRIVVIEAWGQTFNSAAMKKNFQWI